MAVRRARLWVLVCLGLSAATGCSLLVGTETRTLGADGGGVDATADAPAPDSEAPDTSVEQDAGDATPQSDGACGASCVSQAEACGQSCVTVYNSCVAGCSNTPCKTGCATSESACFGNCASTCNGCTTGAGCPNQAACQDASFP